MPNIDTYIKEVISPLLPNAKLGWWINDSVHLFNPQLLQDSIFHYPIKNDATFLHFTSISSLLEIIRSKTIRLSDFNSFKDNFELSYGNNHFTDSENNFVQYKSCLFALSMCEDNKNNIENEYMWDNYAVKDSPHKGVCIKLRFHKEGLRFYDFFLSKIQYCNTKDIEILQQLKYRHDSFVHDYGKFIDNLDEILLAICGLYKNSEPYIDEREVRLLAYIYKGINQIHDDSNYPIRYKFCEKSNQIQYFFELPLEHPKKELPPIPKISIDSVFIGKKLMGTTLGNLVKIIKYEFKKSFGRDVNCVPLFYGIR